MTKENSHNKEGTQTFTVEEKTQASESLDMPSVTKLLNRKSLQQKAPPARPSSGSPPSFSPSPSPSSPPPSPSFSPSPMPTPSPAPEPSPPPSDFAIKIESAPTAPSSSVPEPVSIEISDSSEKLEIETSQSPSPGASQEIEPPPTDGTAEAAQIEMHATPSPSFELSSSEPSLELSPPTPFEVTSEPSAEVAPAAVVSAPTPEVSQPLKVQQGGRRANRAILPLVTWQARELETSKDPLANGIQQLIKKGAKQALFLAITAPPAGSPVPHFVATAAVRPQEKLAVWTGLKWDPTVVPELWNFFVKTGVVELTPPGTQTNLASTRNVVRAAFGVTRSEWLLLIRVGPPQACRGVIAFTSEKSLFHELNAVLPILQATIS